MTVEKKVLKRSKFDAWLDNKQYTTHKTFWKVLSFIFKGDSFRAKLQSNMNQDRLDKTNMQEWNPYEGNDFDKITFGAHSRKFHWIHFIVKNKIMLPILWFVHSTLRKYLVKDIDDEDHNRFLKMYNDAYEKSLTQWNVIHLRNHKHDQKGFKHWLKNKENHDSSQHLRLLKEVCLTMAWYDTAYREFYNMLCINIAKEVNDSLSKTEKLHHLLNINQGLPQVQYYKMYKLVLEVEGMKKERVRVEPVYDDENKDKAHDLSITTLDDKDHAEFRSEVDAEKDLESDVPCVFSKCERNSLLDRATCKDHTYMGGLR